MSRMLVIVLGASLIAGTTISGCGPRLTDEDLGEVQTKASELPGAGEEYELPEPHFTEEDPGRSGGETEEQQTEHTHDPDSSE
jgi:hypothetical protein